MRAVSLVQGISVPEDLVAVLADDVEVFVNAKAQGL
jgi:hypothetical protein